MASEPASRVKPVTKQTFGRASPGAAREAAPEALHNGASIRPQAKLMQAASGANVLDAKPCTNDNEIQRRGKPVQ